MANPRLLDELETAAAHRRAEAMQRQLCATSGAGPVVQRNGRPLINLASNDYLGLATHPRHRNVASQALHTFGTGAGASRLVAGHLPVHEQLERAFAAFKHAEAALLLPTGYMANLAALSALAAPGDLICQDKLNHASLIDAARLTGAELRSYPHLQTQKLQRLLEKHLKQSQATSQVSRSKHPARPPRRFIVTDAVFSMDGDLADLPRLCELARQYDAIVLVDEAHATGLLGDDGAGLCQHQNVQQQVDLVVSTASKALGSLGGLITASQPIIDAVLNYARAAIYTTAVPAPQAAAIGEALKVVRDEPWRRQRVTEYARKLRQRLREVGWLLPDTEPTPILPLLVGSAPRALHLAAHLEQAGFLAVAIRPPTVPPNQSRVRLSLRADLQWDQLERLAESLRQWNG